MNRVWKFIWHDDSIWSWIVNVILAFVIVKFILYPLIGLLLGTSFPVVAVMSSSMEHEGSFDSWWASQSELYSSFEISKDEFKTYKFMNGFNKGDIMVLVGVSSVEKGDVIVFNGNAAEPIIHRVVDVEGIQTKGDNNSGSRPDEMKISSDRILGKAVLRIPFLGWLKLAFVSLIS